MQVILRYVVLLLILVLTITQPINGQLNCENDTTGLISLVDLQTGFYLGEFQGGLYPGGSNTMPLSNLNKGIKVAKSIRPLDSLGNIDYVNGKVYLACFGSSTSVQPFKKYQEQLADAEGLNNCFKTILCNHVGGIENMTIDNTGYWEDIDIEKLIPAGATREQIQVGWMMNSSREDSIYDMPLQADSIRAKYVRAFQALSFIYPNLKILYLTSPYYGGYADTLDDNFMVNQEPCSYHSSFATKWVIEDQMFGDPALRYKEPGRMVPFLSWGPHVWADGMRANTYDGLYWDCADFKFDGAGIHLNDGGKEIFGNMIYDFFLNDTIASFWYKDAPKWASCVTKQDHSDQWSESENVLNIYPSPNTGSFYISCNLLSNSTYSIKIYDQIGRIVYLKNEDFTTDNLIDVTNQNLAPGIYFLFLNIGGKIIGEEFVVNSSR